MNILEVNTVYKFGSTGRIVFDLKEFLEKHGHKVSVACGRSYGGNTDNVFVIGNNFQSHIDAACSRVFDNAGFGTRNPTLKLIDIIEKEKPDIIHLHNIHGYYINVEVLFNYIKENNCNVVWTFHDCWPFTGHCTYFDYVNCNKWKSECNNCVQKKKYPASLLLDKSNANYFRKKKLFTNVNNLTIVTPSNWLCNLVKQSFLCDYKVYCINNGIDLDIFKPTPSDLRLQYDLENKVIILAVASIWGERKGFDNYLKLASKLSDRYRIVMIGVNKNQEKELPSNIIGIRRTSSQRELAAWYSTADVFLSLTEEDNFPTVNLESLACGLPIIAQRVGGSTEAFDEFSGIEINKGSLDKVGEILDNNLYKKLMRDKCIGRAQLYDKSRCYMQYEQLFIDLINRHNNA